MIMKSELGCKTEIFVHTSPKRFNSQDGRDLSAATQWYPEPMSINRSCHTTQHFFL